MPIVFNNTANANIITPSVNKNTLFFENDELKSKDSANVVRTYGNGGGTPGGSDTQVQFNDSSAFGGTANFTWDNANNVLSVVGNVDVGNLNVANTVIANSFTGNGSQLSGIITPQDKPINLLYVAKNGDDTAGTGSINAPYLTIQKAIDVANVVSARTAIITAPGVYIQDLTIASQSAEINIMGSGTSTRVQGNIVISGTSTAVYLDNLTYLNNRRITHSSNGYLSLSNMVFGANTGFTKTSNTTTKVFNTFMGSSANLLLQNGETTFYNCQLVNPQVSGANTLVNFSQCDRVVIPVITAGNVVFSESIIFSTGVGNSITANGGYTVFKNSLCITPTRIPAPVAFNAGSFYSYGDTVFDVANSTFNGTAVFGAIQAAQFQQINVTGNITANYAIFNEVISNTANIAGNAIIGNISTDTIIANTANIAGNVNAGNVITGDVYANYANITGNIDIGGNINYTRTFGCFHKIANVTAPSANTVYEFDWYANTTPHVDTNGVTVTSVDPTRINIDKAGSYSVFIEMQARNLDNQDRSAWIWLAKNGTDIPETTIKIVLLKQWQQVIAKLWLLENIDANDYFEVRFAVDNISGISLEYNDAQVTPFPHPAQPSATITITPVGA